MSRLVWLWRENSFDTMRGWCFTTLMLFATTAIAVDPPQIYVEVNTSGNCVLAWERNDVLAKGWNVYLDDQYSDTKISSSDSTDVIQIEVANAQEFYAVAFDSDGMFSVRSNTLINSEFDLCNFQQQSDIVPSTEECLANESSTTESTNVTLPPPQEGITFYYKQEYSYGRQEQIFVAVLGWETVEGADGYDIYRNGAYYASSGGPADNGGYPIIEVKSELPRPFQLSGCPRCVDTTGSVTIAQLDWQVVAWDRNGNYSSRSVSADHQMSPEHPGIVRLQNLINF